MAADQPARQELRIWLFCSSNSASSTTPLSRSWPSSRSWASLVFVSVPARGGGAAATGWLSALLFSAQRPAWRRETRLETAVAVPAMAAVRAIPLSSGISAPVSRGSLPDPAREDSPGGQHRAATRDHPGPAWLHQPPDAVLSWPHPLRMSDAPAPGRGERGLDRAVTGVGTTCPARPRGRR